jgi:hypothetical protein
MSCRGILRLYFPNSTLKEVAIYLYLAVSYFEILANVPMIFLDVVYGFVLWILSLVPPYTDALPGCTPGTIGLAPC